MYSCEKPVTGKQESAIVNRQESDAWKNDINGCVRIRNNKLAEKLVRDNELKGASKSRFMEVFGKPDKEEKTTLTYYFGAVCNGTKIVAHTDTCFAEFTFKEGKLTGQDYICQ